MISSPGTQALSGSSWVVSVASMGAEVVDPSGAFGQLHSLWLEIITAYFYIYSVHCCFLHPGLGQSHPSLNGKF